MFLISIYRSTVASSVYANNGAAKSNKSGVQYIIMYVSFVAYVQ